MSRKEVLMFVKNKRGKQRGGNMNPFSSTSKPIPKKVIVVDVRKSEVKAVVDEVTRNEKPISQGEIIGDDNYSVYYLTQEQYDQLVKLDPNLSSFKRDADGKLIRENNPNVNKEVQKLIKTDSASTQEGEANANSNSDGSIGATGNAGADGADGSIGAVGSNGATGNAGAPPGNTKAVTKTSKPNPNINASEIQQGGGAKSYISEKQKEIMKMINRIKRKMPDVGTYLEKNLKEVNKRYKKAKRKDTYTKTYDQIVKNLKKTIRKHKL